jgi:hypothetical protein
MKVRHIYLSGRGYKLNNGKLISFWKDTWIGNGPMCLAYPILYELCTNQNCYVFDVAQNGWVVYFKSRLHGTLRDQWYDLVVMLNGVRLSADQDVTY